MNRYLPGLLCLLIVPGLAFAQRGNGSFGNRGNGGGGNFNLNLGGNGGQRFPSIAPPNSSGQFNAGNFNRPQGFSAPNTSGQFNTGGGGGIAAGAPRLFSAPNSSGQFNTNTGGLAGGGVQRAPSLVPNNSGQFNNQFSAPSSSGQFNNVATFQQNNPFASQFSQQSFSQPSFSQQSFAQPQTTQVSFAQSQPQSRSFAASQPAQQAVQQTAAAAAAPAGNNLAVVLKCSRFATGECNYKLIGNGFTFPYKMTAGLRQVFPESVHWELVLDRGDGTTLRYSVSGGEVYEIRKEASGLWSCFKMS